jgi:hypothetical protein
MRFRELVYHIEEAYRILGRIIDHTRHCTIEAKVV